jgi:hypothetical protein
MRGTSIFQWGWYKSTNAKPRTPNAKPRTTNASEIAQQYFNRSRPVGSSSSINNKKERSTYYEMDYLRQLNYFS